MVLPSDSDAEGVADSVSVGDAAVVGEVVVAVVDAAFDPPPHAAVTSASAARPISHDPVRLSVPFMSGQTPCSKSEERPESLSGFSNSVYYGRVRFPVSG